LFEENDQKASTKIKSKELLDLFEPIEVIDPKDKSILVEMMRIVIIKNRMQEAAKVS